MYLLNHIAIIVSNEEGIEFYKLLGFIENKRLIRPECHDEVVYLSNGLLTLEIYKDVTHPKRLSNPESLGLRHLCFQVEDIGDDYKINNHGQKFKYIYDPDGLPIEIIEVKPKKSEDWSFSE